MGNRYIMFMRYLYNYKYMNNDAIAIANYFIDKNNKDTNAPYPLTLLRLVKYVYIAYGFAMAVLDKVIIDKRFDVVEAWKYGPVIPSVYHSFKHNGNNQIKHKSIIAISEDKNGKLCFIEPKVEDKDICMLLDFVWKRYRAKSTAELVDLLHKDNTPWAYCYKESQNIEIPDEMTKMYYKSIVKNAIGE